jgi:hypothetical protein
MTEMIGFGKEPFRTWLIPFISFIPVSPFSYTKEPARSKRAAPYLRRSAWKASSVVVLETAVDATCHEDRKTQRH